MLHVCLSILYLAAYKNICWGENRTNRADCRGRWCRQAGIGSGSGGYDACWLADVFAFAPAMLLCVAFRFMLLGRDSRSSIAVDLRFAIVGLSRCNVDS